MGYLKAIMIQQCVGLRCRSTQLTKNDEGIVTTQKMAQNLMCLAMYNNAPSYRTGALL